MTDPRRQLVEFSGLLCTEEVRGALQKHLPLPSMQATGLAAYIADLGSAAFRSIGVAEKDLDVIAWAPVGSPESLMLYVQRPPYYNPPRTYRVELRISSAGRVYAHSFSLGGRYAGDGPDELVSFWGLPCLSSVERAMRELLPGVGHWEARAVAADWVALAERWRRSEVEPTGSVEVRRRVVTWRAGFNGPDESIAMTVTEKLYLRPKTYTLEWAISETWGPYVRRFWPGDADQRPGSRPPALR